MKKKIKLFSFLAVMALIMLSFKKSPEMKGKCDGEEEYAVGLTKVVPFKLIKDYRVSISSGSPSDPPSEFFMISLKSGLKYRLLPVNNPDNKTKMIMSIYQNEKKIVLLATSFNKTTGKHFPYVDFNCKTTGTFALFFEFEGAAKGCGVGMFAVEN
jgi:hypothetical protein